MTATLICADVREGLRSLPDASVQTVVTSPPYFGLRSYLPDTVKIREDLTEAERGYLEHQLAIRGIRPISEGV